LISTTPAIDGKRVVKYYGMVSGEGIAAASMIKVRLPGSKRRAVEYLKTWKMAKELAINEMVDEANIFGANAVLSAKLEYEKVGQRMLMVSASGTAVTLE
jgi:uncharacterized protein YbjQ (UPF0145 family)